MKNPRATVLQLIAYVTDPAANENEARSMAVRVCHLIVKHGLIESSAPEAPLPPAMSFEDMISTIVRENQERRAQERRARDGRPRQSPHAAPYQSPFAPYRSDFVPSGTEPWGVDDDVPAPPPPGPTVPGGKRVAPDPEAKFITVLQPAWCPGCGQKLVWGRSGRWSRGEVWHSSCFESATK